MLSWVEALNRLVGGGSHGMNYPACFQQTSARRIDSALLITVDTTTGGTYFIVSAWRRNHKGRAYDNEPFGLIVHKSGASEEAVFIHHGDWPGRTQRIPDALVDCIENDGIGDYLWAMPPQDEAEGNLDDLSLTHRGAFREVVREIRARVDGRKSSC